MSLITLLTDFGTADEYVGVMKGVMLSVNPTARIIDITHQIEPQDILHAAHTLLASYHYFPKGTLHVAVVDPGVGTERSIIAAKAGGHVFLAPDNGILYPLIKTKSLGKIVRVENAEFFLESISATFHGRDIFAPVAGHVSMGVPLERLGPYVSLKQIQPMDMPRAMRAENGAVEGMIVSVDRFGNLITNIDEKTILQMCRPDSKKKLSAILGEIKVNGLFSSYQSAEKGTPLMIIGSRGYLEIAVSSGNAGKMLNKQKGDLIVLHI